MSFRRPEPGTAIPEPTSCYSAAPIDWYTGDHLRVLAGNRRVPGLTVPIG